jgi:hypothetical protein
MRRRSRSIARPTARARRAAVGLADLRWRSGPLDPPYSLRRLRVDTAPHRPQLLTLGGLLFTQT